MAASRVEHAAGAGELEPFAWRPVAGIVAVVFVAHAVIATRYGWHRDEFYYVVTGRRLAWGYPDQPPLTPLLARLAAALPGGLWPIRLVAIVCECATIVVAAVTARELGGGRRAQSLTAGCVAAGSIFVGASLLLGTTGTDQLCWAIIIWAVLRALRTESLIAWIVVGVAAGVGLENKHTVAVLLGGMFLGLLVRRRAALAHPGPWVAAVIALAAWAPNLWWDSRHHWVTFSMANVISAKQGGLVGGVAQLPLLLFILPGPLLVFMWMRGARWAIRGDDSDVTSWIVVAAVIVTVVLTLSGGKPYYPAPLLIPLFALGAVATERIERDPAHRRQRIGLVIAVSGVASALISLPVLPPSFQSAMRPLSPVAMETYGWPDFARQVKRATAADPAATAVYVSNYGEAGALQWYGPKLGISVPVVTGHNAYKIWGPPAGTPTHVLAVGEFDRAFLKRSWTHVVAIRRITLPDGLENEETSSDATIFRCTGPKGSWARLWDRLSYLS